MPLPHSYSELYPGRFLKADMLRGRKVTLTIKNVDVQQLVGEKTEWKVIISFVERPLELVLPKTNGFCCMRMFGKDPHDWAGKLITLFPTTTKFGRETVDCIRVWGSPNLASDLHITIPAGRKKPINAIMHKVAPGECGFKGSASIIPISSKPTEVESFEVAAIPDDREPVPVDENGTPQYFPAGAFEFAEEEVNA